MSRFFRRGAATTEVATSETTTSTSQTVNPNPSSTLKSDSNPNPSPSTSLITKPIPNWKRSPTPTFTKEEDEKLNSLKKYAQDLHDGKESTAEELKQDYRPFERKWLDDEHLYLRYLRAAKWDFENAKKRIKGTLEWRRSFQPDIIVPSSVSIEGETGKHVISGFDHFGRPVLYLRPGRENTKPSDRQIRYLVWSLERALDFAPKGVEKIIIFVDFKAATNQTNPGLGTALKVLNILQNHYVERLGRAIVVNLPWVLKAFMAGITPFLDPVTKDKIRFNPPVLSELIPQEQLDKQFGGDYEYQFDFEKYWNTLTDFCGIGEDGKRVHEPYSKTQDDSKVENVPVAVADDDLQPTTSIGNEGQTISKFLHSSRKPEDEDDDDFQDADNENEVEKEDGLESQTTSRAPTLVGLNNGNGNGNGIGGNGVKPLVEDSNRVESANQQVA